MRDEAIRLAGHHQKHMRFIDTGCVRVVQQDQWFGACKICEVQRDRIGSKKLHARYKAESQGGVGPYTSASKHCFITTSLRQL